MSWHAEVDAESNTSGYLKLINLVKQYPILYSNANDTILDSSRFRLNQKEANRCWLEIASQLGITIGECKRRWKNLKEIYTNVQKRHLNKSAKNVPQKKWIYEDAMSFLSVKSDKKNSGNNTTHLNTLQANIHEGENSSQEVKDNLVQTDPQVEQIDEENVEYLELDIDSLSESEKYFVVNTLVSEKQQDDSSIDADSNVRTSLLESNHNIIIENKSFPKYITICSKPESSGSLSTEASILNVTDINNENGYFITTPVITKEELSECTILENSDSKIVNDSPNSETTVQNIAIKSSIKKEKNVDDFSVETKRIKTRQINELLQTPDDGNSIEEFFENMAQAVLKLPTQAQAEVKMEICKLVTMTEIRLSSLQN